MNSLARKIVCLGFIKLAFVLSFFVAPIPAFAYILPPPECAYEKYDDCVRSGELKYVVIYGEIVSSDYYVMRRLERDLPRQFPFPTVYLESGGGKINAAMGIGKILRRNKATVRSENPVLDHVNTECSSACVMIAAGATQRFLTQIGPHSASRMNKQMKSEPSDAEANIRSKEYFDEMGIDPRLSAISDAVPFSEMLDLIYEPRLKGSDQYIVQFGFYQGDTQETDEPDRPAIVRAPFIEYAKHEEIAVLNGSPAALAALVDRYMNGMGKWKAEPDKAVEWLHYGLEHNDKRSAHMLAFHYSKTDRTKAIAIYKRSAEMGSAASQNNLGWAYYKGNGVQLSITDALFWIAKSAEQGEPFAYGSLCEMAADGKVFKNDPAQAFKWCHLALNEMPEGHARDASVAGMAVISKRITDQQRAVARQMIEDWNPLKQTDIRSIVIRINSDRCNRGQ